MRTVRILQTRAETVQIVFPEHANDQGSLYGGRMMAWIATTGTLAASRLARGAVVLGAMDELNFLRPVRVGEVVTLEALVTDVGRSSLEVKVEVYAEDPRTETRRHTTSAHLAFVAVDEAGRPRPVGARVVAETEEEERLLRAARKRREERLARIEAHRAPPQIPQPARHTVRSVRMVFPEDAIPGNLLFAGNLMMLLDEHAAIVATRYARGPVVTASVDALDFVNPVRVGQILHLLAALNFVGRSSMEVGLWVCVEDPFSGAMQHTCTTFVTLVHVNSEGRPHPLPPYVPETPEEQARYEAAMARRAQRLHRRETLRWSCGGSRP
ncbi:MAG: acyl-CoA thioesterase [Armatimonadota bacterium]|nr:acyl-CoA thioesterase [Armatimonadota bacterium]MDR7439955.1 acyl-CoA thioesterase [Armatimonadota bacterium]MDR7562380.1 acyl-CoA thioesterase [Armatimonadota bacterium]MDR7567073.1 acyl-CoA thioesterase [Armatimonadota bacterium]MDR7601538.1 acyl-CoA thioesterase [Armatimonadota bacterium]